MVVVLIVIGIRYLSYGCSAYGWGWCVMKV